MDQKEFENKVNIEFTTDKKRADNFNLALELLGISKEEAFEDFLANLITKALQKNADINNDNKDDKKLSDETIRGRIHKWARTPASYPHIMVKSYINATFSFEFDKAPRAKMQAHFCNHIGRYDERLFISLFRQMCSASSRAYGDVFIYDKATQDVYLNEKYRELIVELKDQFLENNKNY